ncbi:LuxR C-terminal-related transcriptional regulator [Ornithinimicrobium sp. LYQ103]|uniref:LuxR C-terminal-related transcriptional regulator n=1 Tax=Ornithinimicrobium sp. LYQ103 TaxID=3378796 RepID=UPI003852C9A0
MPQQSQHIAPWSAVPGLRVLRDGLFQGKRRMPLVAEGVLHRPRVDQLLDEALHRGSLILSAPAGAGKTQAMVDWTVRHGSRSRSVAWLTLDHGDRDPRRLLRYLAAAVAGTPPGGRAFREVSLPPGVTTVTEALPVQIWEVMSRLDGDVVLVLDSVDAVIGSPSEVLLANVLGDPFQHLRLAVLSREQPHLGQARLLLLGHGSELGEEDLALTEDELRQLLEHRGLDLSGREITDLLAVTAGWVAGVSLVAAALHHRALPDGLHDGVSLATDYLMDEVFAAQSTEVQSFLLRATTADPICADLADALTGRADSASTLAGLRRSRLFLSRWEGTRDDGRTWYHWHPMFANALRRRLAETDPALATELHLEAARWHQRSGSPVEAVRHAVTGGDVAWGAELLGDCWLELAVAGESAVVRSLLDLFDEDLRATQPELAVVCGFLRLRARDLDRAGRCATGAGVLAHQLAGARRATTEAMSTVVRLHVATMTGRDDTEGLREGALELIEAITSQDGYLSHRERVLLALLYHHVGAYEAVRLLADPRPHLEAALSYAATLNLPQLVLRCQAQLAVVELTAGRLHAAKARALEVVTTEREGGWSSPHAAATAYAALGGAELLQGDLASALQHLSLAQDAVETADLVNRFRLRVLTHLTLLTLDRVVPARAELEGLEALVADWEPPPWGRVMLVVLRVDQLMAEGRHSAALALLDRGDDAPLSPDEVMRRTWLAEILRREGRHEQAEHLLGEVLRAGAGTPAALFALVSLALVCEALGRHEEALDRMVSAVAASVREGIVYPYLRLGPDVRLLLEELLDRGTPQETLVVDVLDRLHPAQRAAPLTWYFEPLTAREREVLQAVQGTVPNEEVARRLFISTNTLRTHMKHIHRKLETTSRREAVARGRELGIV